MNAPDVTAGRRPLRSRQSRWLAALARRLTQRGVTPNQISVASVAFAGAAGSCLLVAATAAPAPRALLLLAAAAAIQARLLCNLMDGMVAVEGGRRTPSGEVFNDMPDRVADALILVGAGYSIAATWGPALGWAAALLAVFIAYIRMLGAACGVGHDFSGPMAKQQRMALLTVACAFSSAEIAWGGHGQVMAAGLVLLIAGSIVTAVRRTRRLVGALERR
jgi:phosphatidylglycerophosphate synthase